MEHDEYLKMAQTEDSMWFYRSLHRHVMRELGRVEGLKDIQLLDAGCGTGGLLRKLKAWKSDWGFRGVDLSPLACGLARERTGCQITECSVEALPFADATFDAVVSVDVLAHVPDHAKAVREYLRVLKPGGMVVINGPAYPWLWSYHDEAVHTLRRFRSREFDDLLKSGGFTEVRSTHWNAIPFPLIVAKRKLFASPADTSDVKPFPAPVEACFNAAMSVELAWVKHIGRIPFGCSVLASGRKP